MTKRILLVLVIVLTAMLAAPSVRADDANCCYHYVTVVSDDVGTDTVITKIYNKAGGTTSVVDLSGSPLPVVRASEPYAYTSEPPDSGVTIWDTGVAWFLAHGSVADWIWETPLTNGPASYAPADPRYDAAADTNGRVVLFKTTFNIPGTPVNAVLHVAADNGFEVWVNNSAHHRNPALAAGWELTTLHEAGLPGAAWNTVGQYTFSAANLVQGLNTLYVLAGNEYYAEDDGNGGTPAWFNNPGATIFQLDVKFDNCSYNPCPPVTLNMNIVSDDVGTDTVITKIYNKAGGTTSVVDLSGSPLPVVRASEPYAYTSEPPDSGVTIWDTGVAWFLAHGSVADWIWETPLTNGPASYAPADPRYDAAADTNGRVVLFKTTFNIPGTPVNAVLHVAADNGFEVWVNNSAHHRNPALAAGWELTTLHEAGLPGAAWNTVGQYTFSAANLVQGLNTLYVLAGNEYYAEDDGNGGTPAWFNNPGATIFQLDVTYTWSPCPS